ncbi:MAG: PIN domain-containing protein [Luteibaculaceae bacterium]
MKGQFDLGNKIEKIGDEKFFISEITIAEMKYGIAKSNLKERNKIVFQNFFDKFKVLPIFPTLDVYAEEKSRLKSTGKSLDDFDLLIGSTAIYYDLTLLTRNTNDFDRMKGIRIEGWTK